MDQWSKIIQNLSQRSQEKIQSQLVDSNEQVLIINSPNDWGVARNGGRIGARFAPQALIHSLTKLAQPKSPINWRPTTIDWPHLGESFQGNFKDYQESLATQIGQKLSKTTASKVVHIGGGHDHIYPYLKSLESMGKDIVVFNIDAHMDTRVDELHHSGTPFRQFANESQVHFELIQIGIHSFANPQSNFSSLAKGKMQVYTFNELLQLTQNFSRPYPLLLKHQHSSSNTEYIFSLDCDALCAHEMPGVSAPNPQGLPLQFIMELISQFKELAGQRKSLGIYEYNPLYDQAFGTGARSIANLIYHFIL